MNTSMSTIIFFVVLFSISAISLAEQSPLEDCIRRNIARSLSPPSNKHGFDLSDELCRDETRTIMFFLRLNGNFPLYYVEALCNVFGSDEKKVKEYVSTKWLNHSKKLLGSLTCTSVVKNKSYVETCLRRNMAQSLSPSPSNVPDTSHFDVLRDQLCRDETRIVMYFLQVKRKFPTYYVQALCNVFGDDEKKVKAYVIGKWLVQSKKLIDSLACTSP